MLRVSSETSVGHAGILRPKPTHSWTCEFESRILPVTGVPGSRPASSSLPRWRSRLRAPNVVAPGATQQFTAVARDKNGLVSPGDPIMWTSYTGAALGSVDDDGLYTAATTAVGLDLVYGCAGLAFNFAGVLVSNVGGGDYWAPCWSIGSGLGVAAGTFLHYRMTVYAGKEYAFDTDTDGGGGTTGNADLYLRFGNPPTTSIWEVRRATTSVKENVTWTAPSDGVVWISI